MSHLKNSIDGLIVPMDEITRQIVAEYWKKNAFMEHASIATFARLSLQLISLGAPPHILMATADAMKDEIRHAQVSFAIASHYSGESISPGLWDDITRNGSLKKISHLELCNESLLDGWIGEGVASRILKRSGELSRERGLSEIYASISKDEARHAKLGRDIVLWSLRELGDGAIGGKVRDWLESTRKSIHIEILNRSINVEDYGILGTGEMAQIRSETIDQVEKDIMVYL